jgi:serine/threonine-protein kinase
MGRYTVLRQVGAGGMAELFLAERAAAEGARRRVVLKRILPAFARDPDFRELFVHEARIAMQLSHVNVVQVYDFGEAEDTYVLEMEYVEGCDLRALLRARKALPLGAALRVTIEILRGLDYAHRRASADGMPLAIVHRDVSPGNILLSREGEVKLTDFGLARSRERLGTSVGGVKGTFAFMAPEQACGLPVDARADVFAAGAVLYASLVGRSPFESDGPVATLDRVRAARFAPLSEVALELPAARALDPVLARALALDPGARFASAAAMREALEELARTQGERLEPDVLGALVRAVVAAESAHHVPAPGTATARAARPAEPPPASASDRSVSPAPDVGRTRPLAPRRRRPSIGARATWAAGGLCALGLVAIVALRSAPRAGGVVGAVAPASGGRSPSAAAALGASGRAGVTPPDPSTPGSPAPRAAAAERAKAAPDEPLAAPTAPVRMDAPAGHARPPRAYLTVSADPWAYVAVDGRRRGTTPLQDLVLSPGAHEVTFENPPLGVTRKTLVRLRPGERKTVIEQLAERR